MTALRRTAIACLLVVAALAGTLVATQPASAQASDPTLPGPLATSVIDYDAGITVITSQSPAVPAPAHSSFEEGCSCLRVAGLSR